MSGDAVTLRLFRPDDLEALRAIFVAGDANLRRQAPSVDDEDAFRGYLDWLQQPATGALAIDLDGRLVGEISVRLTDDAHGIGWVSYWLAEAARGRGIMKAAAIAATNLALTPKPVGRGLRRLELGYRANNPASGAVARAAGFIVEGHERAKFVYDGEACDALSLARLSTDPWPTQPDTPTIHWRLTP